MERADHKLRLSEWYTSIQGEGPNVGKPVQFVRFAGCNMRCPGWPCDTQHAIEPSIYLKEGGSEKLTPKDLIANLSTWPRALVLTGGEPFVQPETALREFCQLARGEGYTIETFTNGTIKRFPQWAMSSMSFVLDWKLQGSGENVTGERHGNRLQNVINMRRCDTVKFTVTGIDDLAEALTNYNVMIGNGVEAKFTVGSVWESLQEREHLDRRIVDFILGNSLPWTLNVQLHKYIWDPEARRT